MTSEQFELVLAGLSANSAESLRRVKGALLADLGLTVGEAQAILESLPFTLCSAPNEAALTGLHDLLAKAGAQVHIVRPNEVAPAPLDDAIDFYLEAEMSTPRPTTEETEVIETGLDFFVESSLSLQASESFPVEPLTTDLAPTEFSLELSAPPDLPPLRETVVPQAALLESFPLFPAEEKTTPEPRPLPRGESTPTSVAVPATALAPAPPLPTPRPTDSPHHVPIGRRMRETTPAHVAIESRASAHGEPTASNRTALVTAKMLTLLIGGTLLLGLLNWWFYRL